MYNFSTGGGYNSMTWPPVEDAYPPDSITDRNGNKITSTWSGSGSTFQFTFTDTIGRPLIAGGLNSVTVGGLTYQVAWKTVTPNYTTPSTTPGNPNYNIVCNSIPANTQSETVISSITLPNQTSFTFYYGTDSTPHGAPANPYGLLSEIDYPTGAWVQYTWGFVGMNELAAWTAGSWLPVPAESQNNEWYWAADPPDTCLSQYNTPVVTQRVVSYNGSSVALTQNFQYTTNWPTSGLGSWTSKTTTVTDVDAVTAKSASTVYNYSNISSIFATETPVESSISYYGSGGNLLRTVTKGWVDIYSLYCEVDTLNDGSGQSSGTWFVHGSGDQVVDKREYDFGLVTPAECISSSNALRSGSSQLANLPSATPTRETVTIPATFPPTAAGGGIEDRPSKVQVYANGQQSGTLMAETDYQYDGGTPSVGNPTTITKLCLQSGSACSQGNPTTTYTYDSDGQVTSVTDPCGNGNCGDMPSGGSHTTSYSYLDSYVSCSGSAPPTSPSDAYLTQVTYPQTNGVSHIVTFCYDYAKGLLLSSTDENSQTTTYTYSDPLERLTQTTYPNGDQTLISYNDAPPNPSVTTTKKLNSTQSVVTTSVMDGAGHVIKTELISDPQGTDYTQTTYDGFGRAYTVTNPYRSTSDPTYGVTTYGYDALGRTISVTKPDGSVVSTQYFGNVTLVTDEAGNQRESVTDGLGRLVEVQEPNPGIGTPRGAGWATTTGSEQSAVTSASPGKGTVTIGGGPDEEANTYACCNQYGYPYNVTIWDAGTITVTINGTSAYAYYSQYSTASSLASNLASAINGSIYSVTATASGSTVTITATTSGINTDYTLSVSVSSQYSQYFGSGSFYPQASGSTLTGGENSGPTYDTGTVWLTANGHSTSAAYGQGDTSATVTSRLATAVNNDSAAYVTASASGTTISLTSKATGSSTDYPISASSSTNQTTLFSAPSFSISVSGATLTGGASAGQVGYDALVTTYNYDVMGNLLQVQQQGNSSNSAQWRMRTFDYNSLGQMICSSNPESSTAACPSTPSGSYITGSVGYTYDADGNVATKADARGITTTYSYDPLNRITGTSYSNGDPSVTETYDQPACLGQSNCYNIGHRTTMTDAAGAEYFGYDLMGRMSVEQRTTNGVTETTKYTYDLAGDLTTLTYPSGRTIIYTYDSGGRPSDAVDTANGINYAVGSCANGASSSPTTGACYGPQGALTQLQDGPNLVSTYLYNVRLQPCWTYVTTNTPMPTNTACTASDPGPANIMDLQYNFNLGAGDNGNLMGTNNMKSNLRSQTFSYDTLNRLLGAQTTSTYSTSSTNCWQESYSYDPWANLLGTAAPSSSYTGCTEEQNLPGGPVLNNNQMTGFSYDTAGNMLGDGHYTYTYNAESEIKSAAGVTYTYDGDGNRVEKSSGTIYWYGAGTEILDESNLSGTITNEYIFFGGQRIGRRDPSSNVFYNFDDQLGTARVIVQSGQTAPCYDADFYPFGGERWYMDSCDSHYKFEGKERDTETSVGTGANSGNDDFGARYYSSRLGRWLSSDWSSAPVPVPYANLTNPQTLNLYAMVSDNPETFADLGGHGAPSGGVEQAEPADSGSCDGYKYTCPEYYWRTLADFQASVEVGCGVACPTSVVTSFVDASDPGSAVDIQNLEKQSATKWQGIANQALKTVGSTEYLVAKASGKYAAGKDKCNEYLADTVEKSGLPRPQVPYTGWKGWLGFKRDPSSHEWADPSVTIPGWSSPLPLSYARPGAAIAQEHGSGGHVGIVVMYGGKLMTVSSDTALPPSGEIRVTEWGFRPRGQNGDSSHDPAPVVRLYVGGP